MFTGIITNMGKLQKKKGAAFAFSAPRALINRLSSGDSIAVNGTCLTVEKARESAFEVTLMPETIKRTAFGSLKVGGIVNLELPATSESFLSGHIVQGHVDQVGVVKSIKAMDGSWLFDFEYDSKLGNVTVEKTYTSINSDSLLASN